MIARLFCDFFQAFAFRSHDKNTQPFFYVFVSVLLSGCFYFQPLALGHFVCFAIFHRPLVILYHILNYMGWSC